MKIAGLVATLLLTWFLAPAALAQMTFRGVTFDMTDAELQQAGANLGLELGTDADNPIAGAFVRFDCGYTAANRLLHSSAISAMPCRYGATIRE